MHKELPEPPATKPERDLVGEIAYQIALDEQAQLGNTRRLRTSVRDVSAESTLRSIQPLFGDFGISKLIDVSLEGVPGCPVFQVIRDDMRSEFFNAGKGFTRVESMVSALMEAIEVHCYERADQTRVVDVRTLVLDCRGGTVITPHSLAEGCVERVPLDQVGDVLLVRGIEHHSGESVFFHSGNVFLEFADGERVHASPNGIASGNSVTEALCHALFEILERHALAGFYRQGKANNHMLYQQLERVAPPTGLAHMRACLSQLRSRDISAEFILISTEGQVPVFTCFLDIPLGSGVRGAVQGYGAHHAPKIAMSRALGEAVQILALCPVTDGNDAAVVVEERVLMTSKQAAALDPQAVFAQRLADHAFLDSLRDKLQLIDYEYVSFPEDVGAPFGSAALLEKLMAGLKTMGCAGVYSCVISPPSLPIVVVKCFCPGLDSIPGL